MTDTEPWRAIAARKEQEQLARIPQSWRLDPECPRTNLLEVPRTCDILNERELRITEYKDATALLEDLTTGRQRSVDVVTAFCKRAAVAHQLVLFMHESLLAK